MGLLIQTSVLIMVIAIITYSRLDLFLPKKALENEIVNYMSHTERAWMNSTAVEYYESLTPTVRGAQAEKEKSMGTGYISLRPLFNDDSQQMENTKAVLRSLLTVLYSDQPFVLNEIKQGAYLDPPSLFNALIDAIIQAGKNRPIDDVKKQMKASQFKQLNLGPMQSIFVNVVNGCTCTSEILETPNITVQDAEEEESESEGSLDIVPRNYCSLFSFANLQPYRKLSIYLAPEETLLALYGSQQIVDDIIRTRTLAYQEYRKSKSQETRAALERFKSIPTVVDANFLDFTVTNTNPDRKRKKK